MRYVSVRFVLHHYFGPEHPFPEEISMSLIQRILSGKYRRDAAIAGQIIKETVENAKKPKSGTESAAMAAETRQRVFSVIETVEAQIGQLAVVIAQDTGTLMIHPKLIEEIRKRPDQKIIEHALYLCFPTRNASQLLNVNWPARVAKYNCATNTEEILREKAIMLATFVVYNLDAGMAEIRAHPENYAPEMTEEEIQQKECFVRLEEAACWYRVIDELAYRSLRCDERSLFMDHFQDHLSNVLVLQGTPPSVLCPTMADRTEEYEEYRKWIPDGEEGTRGTLLWEAAKHVGEPFGFKASGNPIFLVMFGVRFLERLNGALVWELLNDGTVKKQA
jgi:hypothetical protein